MNAYTLQHGQMSDELLLQLEFLKGKEIDWNRFVSIDWELFLQLVIHHRTFPSLYQKIRERNIPEIPASLIQVLKQETRHNQIQMMALQAEMLRVNQRLTVENIPILFLKGPTLAQDLYGDLSKRTSCDLDALISIDDLERAEEVLAQLGYEKDDYIETVLEDWKWRHHHFGYVHTKTGMKFELHWRLNPGPSKDPSFRQLWERRHTKVIANQSVSMLGREDLFLFLVSHGARHGWSRLRWLVDIHQLVQQDINWDIVVKRMKKYRYRHIGGQALVLASALFDTPLVEGMLPLLRGKRPQLLAQKSIFYFERMVRLHDEDIPKDVFAYHQKYLFTLMCTRQKFVFLSSLLYPYPEDAKTLPLPKSVHFLYFPLRPLLIASRKMSKKA